MLYKKQANKNPASAGFLLEADCESAVTRSLADQKRLLDFRFLVDHMLANNGIVLFDFHFLRHVALVFVSRVEMTGARAGN